MLPLEKEILHSIKKLRKEKKILSKTMAHKLGIRAEHYSRLEKGKLKLDLAMLFKIAQMLNVDCEVSIRENSQRINHRVIIEEKPHSKARILDYDARKDLKEIDAVTAFQTPDYFRSGKVYAERDMIEKLQQTIVSLEKVIQIQEVEKKHLWKLVDQIEGLQLIAVQKKV